MKYQTKYFDIDTKAKRTNGWERSLLELKRMMNAQELHRATPRLSHRKVTQTR